MEKNSPRLITLTTDLGVQDPVSASIKGVLFTQCPGVRVVDLGNEISSHNITEAALFLLGSVPYFPSGTVHLVSVAPGPTPIAVHVEGQYLVCPDNGVATLLCRNFQIEGIRAIALADEIANRKGQVFFGREVFAPAAAQLARGVEFADIGSSLEKMCEIDWLEPRRADTRRLDGRVMDTSRFGNLITNIRRSDLEGMEVERVSVGGNVVYGISGSYEEVAPKKPLAIFGHHGYLEIAYRNDRADERFKITPGMLVSVFLERK